MQHFVAETLWPGPPSNSSRLLGTSPPTFVQVGFDSLDKVILVDVMSRVHSALGHAGRIFSGGDAQQSQATCGD